MAPTKKISTNKKTQSPNRVSPDKKKNKTTKKSSAPESPRDSVFLSEQEPAIEGEDDLQPLRPEWLRESVVTSTDWTTETILSQIDKGTIELNPSFQRRDAWNGLRKSRFIESLVMGLPIPQIVLAERRDKRGQFIVLDGKQRLLALHQFAGQKRASDEPYLSLSGLQTLKDLNDQTYPELSLNAEFSTDLDAFHNQTIRAMVVKNWPDEDFLYLVFLRLNTGSVSLSPQELRQALHPGPFVQFANDRSAESTALQMCLGLKRPDFRMRDVELFIRFYAFHYFLETYSGNMKDFLDNTCKELNEQWTKRSAQLHEDADNLDAAIMAVNSIFGEDMFSLWRKEKFEGRFNRAIFDMFLLYFGNTKVREKSLQHSPKVKAMFIKLCQTDTEFVNALQFTTKSLPSTGLRLEKLGDALGKVIKMNLTVPTLVGGRLKYT